MAQQALVLYCVQYDQQAQTCTQQAWLPAPSLLPPLPIEQAGQLLSVIALVYAAAWGWKKLGQHTQK